MREKDRVERGKEAVRERERRVGQREMLEGGKCWSRKIQKEILKHLNEFFAIYSFTLATIICHRNLFVQGVIIGLTLPSYDFFRLVTKRFICLNRYFFDYKSELFPDANAPQMPASFSVLLYYANSIFWANFKKLFFSTTCTSLL